jgi:hypothetical protein
VGPKLLRDIAGALVLDALRSDPLSGGLDPHCLGELADRLFGATAAWLLQFA